VRGGRYGIESMCVAGGVGRATAERAALAVPVRAAGAEPDALRRAVAAAVAAAALGYSRGRALLAAGIPGQLNEVARRLELLERRVDAAGL
jgi:hypothetical protein